MWFPCGQVELLEFLSKMHYCMGNCLIMMEHLPCWQCEENLRIEHCESAITPELMALSSPIKYF
jgi:YgiT-type zinc finger domain-containing protein